MDDDLLFGGQHRFSPDRQWAGSPPSCSQQDDGYRITWGPSMNSVLANCKANALQPASKIKSSNLLAHVKRSSASAGFPSPTRPVASTSNTNPRSNANTSQNSASDTSADTSVSSVSSPSSTTASRLSKRRRRFLPSSSTPALDFDVSARNNTSHGPRSLSADDTSFDVTEMLGELARRLQASRKAAAEQEKYARLPLSNKENVAPGRGGSSAVDSNNAKGKQREKVAISPAVSTVVEESMSQGMAGMLLNSAKSDASSHRSKESVSAYSKARHADNFDPPECQEKSIQGQRSEGAQQGTASAAETFSKCELQTGQDRVIPLELRKVEPATLKINLQEEEDLWDENDKSLEIAMSQMDIPDPPSSQQGAPSHSAKTLNLPLPHARLHQASHEAETRGWEGFKSRDKRVREKSSDSSSASIGKLSSKPLVASQTNYQNKPLKVESNDASTTLTSDVKTEPVRSFSKSTSTSSDKLRTGGIRPVMASARSCGSNTMAAPSLTKKFKCPTVTNTAAAKAEQEKRAAAAAKLVNRAGQPLPAEEAWMEDMDMDWNVDDSL